MEKFKKQVLAMVYPVNQQSVIKKLAGKYRHKIDKNKISIEKIKEFSMIKTIEESIDFRKFY